jgi:hypothetical protein
MAMTPRSGLIRSSTIAARMALRYAGERSDVHRATGLVNEVYLRLLG